MSILIEFTLKGDDATGTKLKAMVDGIANQMGDRTVIISERKIILVSTENAEVGAILKSISGKSNSNSADAGVKKIRGRKKKVNVVAEENEGANNARD